ncbi:MAG: tetratricopeptide repeat protein [Proteobacteria bacterium]|nr:tetratricopeptide repeat protein [Pseudomonadota bacterium]
MKISYLFIATALLCSSGCANQNVWVNPSKNDSEAQKDFSECKYDSQKSSFVPYGNVTSPISAGVQEGFQNVTLMNECMRSRGYNLINKYEWDAKIASNKQSSDEFNLAMKEKNYDKSMIIINIMIAQNPNAYDPYHGRGNVYYFTNKYSEAITDYNKAISLGCKSPKVFVFKAQAFIELGEYDVAIQSMNDALAIKSDPMFYNMRAYALNKKGEYDKAMDDCNRAIALDTTKPNFFKNRGLAYHGKLEFEKAIEQFNKSISIDPAYYYAYAGRGEAYLKIGKLENATSDFKKACELGDKDSCSKLK